MWGACIKLILLRILNELHYRLNHQNHHIILKCEFQFCSTLKKNIRENHWSGVPKWFLSVTRCFLAMHVFPCINCCFFRFLGTQLLGRLVQWFSWLTFLIWWPRYSPFALGDFKFYAFFSVYLKWWLMHSPFGLLFF